MSDTEWWKNAVVYQIYPRSFQDSNNDGIGDIQGIIRRLDYIANLGADVIWLCPVYDSPNADNGYDIRNYYQINPEYGTMTDFNQLLDEVHKRNMKLIMDLVVNHTSDEHMWFTESRKSKDNPYRDFYIWKEGKNGEAPNNWSSWFGGSAWERDSLTGMYYLHIFHKKQPDLNWDNPKLREAVYSMMRWWLNKGIDGFRMDVISLISKQSNFPDGINGNLSPFCINGPRVHEYLMEMNQKVLCKYPIMTVGECPNVTTEQAKKYAGSDQSELNIVFQFDQFNLTDGELGKWTKRIPNLKGLKKVFEHWQKELYNSSWNCLLWSNHDQPRAVSRFGNSLPEYRDISAKMLCMCLYLMQGTPFIYQGEELGMTNAHYFDISQYRDIESIRVYYDFIKNGVMDKRSILEVLANVSRDNARTPMQWENNAGAGFTEGRPWISPGPNWRSVNAEKELGDENSVYYFYQKVLRFRKNNELIRNGSFELLWPEHESAFGYIRKYQLQSLFVICNFSEKEQVIPDMTSVIREKAKLVLSNYQQCGQNNVMRAYEANAYVYDASEEM